ncbi:MAG: hypothetical protein PSY14_12070 [bacterium]|nr:hypothetical protein [bacterium]
MPSTGVILTILAILAALFLVREHFVLWQSARKRSRFWVNFLPDDPILVAAAEKARATLPAFDALREQYPRYASLALGPIREDGDTTPALVREKLADGYIVCHAQNKKDGTAVEKGEPFTVRTEDIVDWIVYENEQKERIHGGYTLRAVVEIAERNGQVIPPFARRQFEKFVKD